MGARRYSPNTVVFNTTTANGVGAAQRVKDFRHINIQLATLGVAGGEGLTIKFQGAVGNTSPDFSAAATSTNLWDYIGVVPLNSQSPIAGDTGVVVSGADVIKLYVMNVDALDWMNIIISGTAGTSTTLVQVRGYLD